MKVLIIDIDEVALGFALECQRYGHSVRLYNKASFNKPNCIGDGLVTKIDDWKTSMKWADLVYMSTNTNITKEIEPYFKAGFPIFGCNYAGSRLELDRQLGQKVFKSSGLDVIPYEEFYNYDKAIQYVVKQGGRHVSKPMGDKDKALSYVSKSPKGLISMLSRWKQNNKTVPGFILQEFVQGKEFAVMGFFGKNGFSECFLENFEHKKLMSGDSGKTNTGEQGTVIKFTYESRLADMVLKPIQYYLHSINYVGMIDVAVIIDDTGSPRPLEFTCRPGWPIDMIRLPLMRGDPAQWMLDCLQGYDTIKVSEEIATGVVLAAPPYPYFEGSPKKTYGYPIYAPKYMINEGFVPSSIAKGKIPNDRGKWEDGLITAGTYIGAAVGKGETVEEASEEAYNNIAKIEIPNNCMWRDDIGERCDEDIKYLQERGFCEDWKYDD